MQSGKILYQHIIEGTKQGNIKSYDIRAEIRIR